MSDLTIRISAVPGAPDQSMFDVTFDGVETDSLLTPDRVRAVVTAALDAHLGSSSDPNERVLALIENRKGYDLSTIDFDRGYNTALEHLEGDIADLET